MTQQAPNRLQSDSLLPLITGYMPARVVHVAAQLGIADRLKDGAKNAGQLAGELDVHEPSLRRFLRAMCSIGLLSEAQPASFSLTPLGNQLRSDASRSAKNLALMFGGERAWRCWEVLLESVRTGQSGMKHVYGMGSFEYLAANPSQSVIFNRAMAEITRAVTQLVIRSYDFSKIDTLIDVGGGNGALIAGIVAANSHLRGKVFDLPAGCADARQTFEAAGVADRCDVVPGDFFKEVPTGAHAYTLKNVIHDWNDQDSLAILRACRKAADKKGKLLIIERIMPELMTATPENQRKAMLDMNMLAMPGGQERTEAEYRHLLQQSGSSLKRIIPLGDLDIAIIEAESADS
jgi:O-methyltransferase/methyltransferase family protein